MPRFILHLSTFILCLAPLLGAPSPEAQDTGQRGSTLACLVPRFILHPSTFILCLYPFPSSPPPLPPSSGSSASPASSSLALPLIQSKALAEADRVWKDASAPEPPPGLASRSLFTAALAYAETKSHPDRVETLLKVAARMQQSDPALPHYGNFRWAWGHEGCLDLNAVDFSMQGGSVLWLRHRETLSPAARDLLKPLLEKGIEGLLRHRVRENYTNIALMNAGNLILLGESLNRRDALDAGLDRLSRTVLNLWEEGVHEYASPTYYGVNLTDVLLIDRFARNESARIQARAVRQLLWTDIALNWFPGSAKLAGPHSRSYDYLRGLGELDGHLQLNGWIDTPNLPSFFGSILLTYQESPPSPRLLKLSQTFPRLVTAAWGPERDQTRTHYLCADVTLGSAATSYGGRMDIPLTVDLPGPREGVRGYFIPDGRGDPYGKTKVKESQAHSKTIHLQPFWTAAQRRTDALGLAVYRPSDVPPESPSLESHFVLPENMDEAWVDGQPVTLKPRQKAIFPLRPNGSLIVRKGTALIGLRVPWSADVAGKPAAAALVCDGNSFGAMRLTVTHHVGGNALPGASTVGAALWVRIGSDLKTPAEIEAWRRGFGSATTEVKAEAGEVSIKVQGGNGPLAVGGSAPFSLATAPVPATPRHVLACDGRDLGEDLLQWTAPVQSLRKAEAEKALKVPALAGVYAEAEGGIVLSPMVAEADPTASGGSFAWMPVSPGERAGSSVGRVRLRLDVDAPGTKYLWGRVLTPTADNDSFLVSLSRGRETLLFPVEWHAGVRKEWSWVRLNGPGGKPLDLSLPKGISFLDVRVREGGAKLDRLFLTSDPTERPK